MFCLGMFLGCTLTFIGQLIIDHLNKKPNKELDLTAIDLTAIDVLQPASFIDNSCQESARKEFWEYVNRQMTEQNIIKEIDLSPSRYKVIPYDLLIGTLESYGYLAKNSSNKRFTHEDYDRGFYLTIRIAE